MHPRKQKNLTVTQILRSLDLLRQQQNHIGRLEDHRMALQTARRKINPLKKPQSRVREEEENYTGLPLRITRPNHVKTKVGLL